MNTVFTILSADDYEDDFYLLRQAFNKVNAAAHLRSVRDGVEAVAYLKGEGQYADRSAFPVPDILLLDLNMPRMNGFEVLQWVRKDPQFKRLLVYVFTASVREADVERAYELGANSYIVKPSRVDELVSLVTGLNQWHRFMVLPKSYRGKEVKIRPSIAAKREYAS